MVAVPWAVYSPSSDLNVLTVTVDRERIYNAPVFDYARIEEYSRPEYMTNVYSYYGVSGGAVVGVGVSGSTTTGTTTTTGGTSTTGAARGTSANVGARARVRVRLRRRLRKAQRPHQLQGGHQEQHRVRLKQAGRIPPRHPILAAATGKRGLLQVEDRTAETTPDRVPKRSDLSRKNPTNLKEKLVHRSRVPRQGNRPPTNQRQAKRALEHVIGGKQASARPVVRPSNLIRHGHKLKFFDPARRHESCSAVLVFGLFGIHLAGLIFDRGCIARKIFHTHQPNQTGEENNSRHEQKCHVEIRVTADISKQPGCLHIAERMDDEDVGSKCRRTYSG